jgi:hypothetical protein
MDKCSDFCYNIGTGYNILWKSFPRNPVDHKILCTLCKNLLTGRRLSDSMTVLNILGIRLEEHKIW